MNQENLDELSPTVRTGLCYAKCMVLPRAKPAKLGVTETTLKARLVARAAPLARGWDGGLGG